MSMKIKRGEILWVQLQKMPQENRVHPLHDGDTDFVASLQLPGASLLPAVAPFQCQFLEHLKHELFPMSQKQI